MLNIVIYNSNTNDSYKLVNHIEKKLLGSKVYTIVTQKDDITEIFKQYTIDIIILILSNKSEIDFIKSTSYLISKTAIILLSKDKNIITKLPKMHFYNNVEDFNAFLPLIEHIQKSKGEDRTYCIKRKISKYIKLFKYNLSYTGTKYLNDAIFEIYLRNEFFSFNLERDIYPILSRRYNKSISNIKNSIIQATKIMYCECEEEILKQYFCISERPTTKDVIVTILDNIMEDFQNKI